MWRLRANLTVGSLLRPSAAVAKAETTSSGSRHAHASAAPAAGDDDDAKREKRKRRRVRNKQLREQAEAYDSWSPAQQQSAGFHSFSGNGGWSSAWVAAADDDGAARDAREFDTWRSVCGRPRSRSEAHKLMRAWRHWSRASSGGVGGSDSARSEGDSWVGSGAGTAAPGWKKANASWADFQEASDAYQARYRHQFGGGDWWETSYSWHEAQQEFGSASAGVHGGGDWWQTRRQWSEEEASSSGGWRRQWAASSISGSSEVQASLRTLGLQGSSRLTAASLKQAYHKACMQHHPDRHTDSSAAERAAAERRFKEAQARAAARRCCFYPMKRCRPHDWF